VHHFALLIGYGATAINPYLAYETLADMIRQGTLTDIEYPKARDQYIKASVKGVVKTLSKMGISTIQSYCGAQIFEALGLSQELVDEYFTWTPTRIEGIGWMRSMKRCWMRHRRAFPRWETNGKVCPGPAANITGAKTASITSSTRDDHLLQQAVRTGNYEPLKAIPGWSTTSPRQWHAARAAEFKYWTSRFPSMKWSRSSRSAALQDRRDVLRLHQQGGARERWPSP
jgi:glutamate synthase (NADPH/NADH) large chain